MHKYEKEARESGKSTFHFAWVLDEQEEERARGVTIDVGVCSAGEWGEKVGLDSFHRFYRLSNVLCSTHLFSFLSLFKF